MNIYAHKDYRIIIQELVAQSKAIGKKLTFQQLATDIRVQKSYFSKILSGLANLNSDQVFLLCERFGFNQGEKEYFSLLVERERTAISERQSELDQQIKSIHASKTQTQNYIDKEVTGEHERLLSSYYLDPAHLLVHIAFSIKKYSQDLEKLKIDLGLSDDQFATILSNLESLGLIQIKNNRVSVLKTNLHLSKESPFFWAWRTTLQLQSLQKMKVLNEEESYNFSVCFSADLKVQSEIRNEFMKFLKRTEKLVKASPAKNMYQLNFDLFKWL